MQKDMLVPPSSAANITRIAKNAVCLIVKEMLGPQQCKTNRVLHFHANINLFHFIGFTQTCFEPIMANSNTEMNCLVLF